MVVPRPQQEEPGLPAPAARLRHCRAGALTLAATLGGCSGANILEPVGPVGVANRQILIDAFAIMMAIIVPTIIATLVFGWWYREGNSRARYRPDFVYSGRIELIVWSIPILVIMFLGGVIWVGSHRLDPHRPIPSDVPPLQVQVVAMDWKWLFIYPDQGIATVNQLILPVGVPVHFRLTSASVMNVFFVPRLGSQIYAMNGMATELWLRADQPGTYYGRSAHYSGDGFSRMHFATIAVPPERFGGWAAAQRGNGRVLDRTTYPKLAEQSRDVPPFTIGAVEPRLFDAVVMQQLPPAPGPDKGRGGPGTRPSGG